MMIRALMSAIVLAASGTSALACSCVRNATADELLARSAAVFTGIAKTSVTVATGQSETTFRVTEGFKGARAGSLVRVRHGNGPSASCGVRFKPGTVYTLTAHDGTQGLSTSLCSTWMFQPQSEGADELIARIRLLRGP